MSRFHSLSRSYSVLAAFALVSLTGCGAMPTSPVATSARLEAGNALESSTPVRTPSDPGDGSVDGVAPGSGGTPPTAAPGVATSVLIGFSAHPALRTVTSLDADITSAGGSLTNGRWRVDVPAGAVAGSAHFTLTIAGGRSTACQLQVEPANALTAPLTLSVDCRGQFLNKIADLVLLSFDPVSGTWTALDSSSIDRRGRTLSASIVGAGIFGAGTPSGTPAW